MITLFFTKEGKNRTPLGAIVLLNDASQFFYPLIQRWPLPSKTAETLLVMRDGDDVLYINNLRYRPDGALKLRIPSIIPLHLKP